MAQRHYTAPDQKPFSAPDPKYLIQPSESERSLRTPPPIAMHGRLQDSGYNAQHFGPPVSRHFRNIAPKFPAGVRDWDDMPLDVAFNAREGYVSEVVRIWPLDPSGNQQRLGLKTDYVLTELPDLPGEAQRRANKDKMWYSDYPNGKQLHQMFAGDRRVRRGAGGRFSDEHGEYRNPAGHGAPFVRPRPVDLPDCPFEDGADSESAGMHSGGSFEWESGGPCSEEGWDPEIWAEPDSIDERTLGLKR